MQEFHHRLINKGHEDIFEVGCEDHERRRDTPTKTF